MNKKMKMLFLTLTLLLTFSIFLQPTRAVSGNIIVHYLDDERKPTYDYAKTHGSAMGYTVYGFNANDNRDILNQLAYSSVMVMHLHGDPGRQVMKSSTAYTYLSGKGGNGDTIKSINSMNSNSLSKMKLAIYYGCQTGVVSSTYGDICQETVNKGAQACVAWKVTTYVGEVNEWNRLFFEKAKTDNIVESFRHADYWLRYIKGNEAGDRMQITRNEKGNVDGYINK